MDVHNVVAQYASASAVVGVPFELPNRRPVMMTGTAAGLAIGELYGLADVASRRPASVDDERPDSGQIQMKRAVTLM